jgi:hypothetical protein
MTYGLYIFGVQLLADAENELRTAQDSCAEVLQILEERSNDV